LLDGGIGASGRDHGQEVLAMSETTSRHAHAVTNRSAGNVRATGQAVSAAWIMITVGAFQIVAGLAGLMKDNFYGRIQNYVFDFDVTAWGWIHLLIGVVVVLTGGFILRGARWARTVGIVLAALSAVSNFLFLPYYPISSVLIVALDVAVIQSLCAREPQW
jgi:hypothetical protein